MYRYSIRVDLRFSYEHTYAIFYILYGHCIHYLRCTCTCRIFWFLIHAFSQRTCDLLVIIITIFLLFRMILSYCTRHNPYVFIMLYLLYTRLCSLLLAYRTPPIVYMGNGQQTTYYFMCCIFFFFLIKMIVIIIILFIFFFGKCTITSHWIHDIYLSI